MIYTTFARNILGKYMIDLNSSVYMIIGFTFAAYSVVANDSVQTLRNIYCIQQSRGLNGIIFGLQHQQFLF